LSASHALPSGVFWETRAIFILTKLLFLLATPAGFEPATPSLEGWCSKISLGLSAAAKSGSDGEAQSERENLFYNLPGCSGPVHGFSGVACKTLPFEIVEKTI
jgi:hypothetical protein